MTFGAMPGWQAWLFLALSVALAAYLFLLKLRPPRLLVPSLLLWRRVLDESREQTLWERIRRAVSLAVTILIALLLALAAARPSREGPTGTGTSQGRLLLVIDSSWSMLAHTRSGETRWDRAVAEARRLAAAAAGGEIALATTADGLAEGPTADRALIEAALDRISPAAGDATAWPRLGGATAAPVVHFMTDGTIGRTLEPGVIVHSVFEPAANVAITAFDVRPSLADGHAGDAYLEVANYAPAAQQVRLTVTRGTASFIERKIDLGAGETLRQSVPIARGGDALLRARIEARNNALDADDEAVAWVERARPLAIALVSYRSAWLAHLFEGGTAVRTTVIDPGSYPSGADRADAIVFDAWAPADPPERPALFIAPPADTAWLMEAGGAVAPALAGAREERRPRWDSPGSHPVVHGVDPFTLSIDRARTYTSPALVPVARSSRGTPLVYVSEAASRRLVIVTFGPGESNLASAPGFPVLIGNALDWLVQPPLLRSSFPLQPSIASFDDSVGTLTGPRGTSIPLTRVNGTANAVLRVPGLYVAQGGGTQKTIAVNAGHPQTSNVMRTTLGATSSALAVKSGTSGRPWWIYCALVAFALAIAEWWTWQRRITV